MNGFGYIYAKTLAQVLMKANDKGITKDEFVSIENEGDVVVLVYYKNG